MKLHFTKETLLQGVQIVQSALSPRTTLPILHNFLLETENSKVKIASTDLEMGIKYYLPAEVESAGGTTLPAKKFLDILQSLPEDKDVELSVDSSNKTHLKCGRSRFWIVGIPKAEYPVLPEFPKEKSFPIPWGALESMVRKTIFAVSTDETRYVLNGVLWNAAGGDFSMVATDGRRLAMVEKKGLLEKGREFKVIVPAKALSEALRLGSALGVGPKDSVQLSVTDNQVSFQMKDATMVSRVIEGTFPNHEQVIPTKKDVTAKTKTTDLAAITKRAALCTAERGGAVKYEFKNGQLRVTAAAQSVEFEDEIEADFKGKDFLVSFNSLYLLDLLKATTAPEVVWSMTTPQSPVLFEPVGDDGLRYVVMPMRVS